MKNQGFTIVELIVVVGIISVLAFTVAPKLISIIAKAKDSKVIAVLGAMRGSSKIYYNANEKTVLADSSSEMEALNKLIPLIQNDVKKMFNEAGDKTGIWKEGEVDLLVGGSKDTLENKSFKSGGRITFTFVESGGVTNDGVQLWLKPLGETGDYDTKGKKWVEY